MLVKRFWIIEPVQNKEAKSVLMGCITPKRNNFKLWGVQYTLLCFRFMQYGTDLLAAIGYDDSIGKQDYLKSNLVLPHGQRDAYSECSGVNDLQHLIMLPKPIKITQPIWIKGHCNPLWKGKRKDGLFDVMVDVFYEGSVKIDDFYPTSGGDF